jgi:hypothetical protein
MQKIVHHRSHMFDDFRAVLNCRDDRACLFFLVIVRFLAAKSQYFQCLIRGCCNTIHVAGTTDLADAEGIHNVVQQPDAARDCT